MTLYPGLEQFVRQLDDTGRGLSGNIRRPEGCLWKNKQQFVKPPKGCIKTETNYNRQVTDTSAINVFFSDNAFRKIVLGENYFKLTGLDSEFVAPEMCPPV